MFRKCVKEILREMKDISICEKIVTIKTKMDENSNDIIELAEELLK